MTQEIRMIDVTLLKSKSSRNKRYNFIERSTGDRSQHWHEKDDGTQTILYLVARWFYRWLQQMKEGD